MNYKDLVNIDDFQKRESFNLERGEVAFYCKDCEKIVQTNRPNENGYIFECQVCKGNNIAIGTFAWIKETYKIK